VLVHGYFGLRDETVWDAAVNLVPVLAKFVEEHLKLLTLEDES
jgi:uncharacterized protein with HEPN domain